MKLTLQLVVVFLNASKKFRELNELNESEFEQIITNLRWSIKDNNN